VIIGDEDADRLAAAGIVAERVGHVSATRSAGAR
jgi:hypothetical protein